MAEADLRITQLNTASIASVGIAEHTARWDGDPDCETFHDPTVIFTTVGSWCIHRRGRRVAVDPSVVVLGHEGCDYRCSHVTRRPDDKQVFISYRRAGLARLLESHPDREALEIVANPFPAVDHLRQTASLHRLLFELTTPEPASQLRTDALALELLLALRSSTTSTADLKADSIAAAKRYIEEHFHEDVALADLSAAVHVSPFHLHRRFREATGATPHVYLTRVRLEHAGRLLASTDLSVLDVSLAVGFKNPSHFANVFRHHHGIPPTAWRCARRRRAGSTLG